MPCRDYGSDDYGFSDRQLEILKRKADEMILKDRADMLARIACRALEAIEAGGGTYSHLHETVMRDKETADWWVKHKEEDKKQRLIRLKEELKKKEQDELKKRAYAKLTEEERQLFGLNKKKADKQNGTRSYF